MEPIYYKNSFNDLPLIFGEIQTPIEPGPQWAQTLIGITPLIASTPFNNFVKLS